MKLAGAVMMVTGASSGIGAATAAAASAAGARPVLLARSGGRLDELATDLPDALAIRCDVTVQEEVDHAVRAVLERFGRIDVLVNNAGQTLNASVVDTDLDDFRAILELNLIAPLRLMQAVMPIMRVQNAGAIVNVSSGTTLSSFVGTGAYAASKAALEQLSAVARAESASGGVTVSTILPSLTRTKLLHNARGKRESDHDMAGAQAPQQVAHALLGLIQSGQAVIDLVPEEYGGSYRS